MLDNVKKAAMNGAMKILTHPTVSKLMSDPRVMNALGKGLELQGKIRTHVESTVRSIAESLNLVPRKNDKA